MQAADQSGLRPDMTEQITAVFADFADPTKRVFVGYLALAAVIAVLWLVALRRHSAKGALGRVFDRRIFLSRSSLADYGIFVVNYAVTTLISPLLLTQLAIATTIYFALHGQGWVHAGALSGVPQGLVVALFTVVMFTIDDFTKYLFHRWMHKWPALWAFHKVHHSAETLTPVTVYRVHPLEGVLYALRSALAQGAAISIFVFLFDDAVDFYAVVGVNVLVFVFHVTGSNLRHSHISIRYWAWLERIVISPAQHQLHHSIAEEHYDKNFGATLAVWDWMFGSLHLSEEDDLEFGLLPGEGASATNLWSIYTRPFVEIIRMGVAQIQRWLPAKAPKRRQPKPIGRGQP